MKRLISIISLILLLGCSPKQELTHSKVFGDDIFANCIVDLTLYDQENHLDGLKDLHHKIKGMELLQVNVDGDVPYPYIRYYLDTISPKGKLTYALEEYRENDSLPRIWLTHPLQESKNTRYYVAECFDEVLAQNPKLKDTYFETGQRLSSAQSDSIIAAHNITLD
jgi:hypothetical protein